MLYLAILILAASVVVLAITLAGSRKMLTLAAVDPEEAYGPLVSVIIPACNEAKTLGPALRALFAQDYADLEIIAIDDRSTDNTWQVLQELAREFSGLRLERIRTLPSGWLGKNHALFRGAELARGELLLFTDADVILEPTTLSRAVSFFTRQRADHLCLVFANTTPGLLLNAMIVDALGGLFLLLKPWNAAEKNSPSFIGIGAFNLISSRAYQDIGGHRALRMHPIDDVMLGKKVKQRGLRQYCLLGRGFVTVPWYATVREMVGGLMKNVYAMYGYRLLYAAVGIGGIVVMTMLPPWGVLLCRGWPQLMLAAALTCRLLVFTCNSRLLGIGPGSIPFALLTPYLMVYIIIKAVVTTIGNQGIDWRGTHYPLKELQKEEMLLQPGDFLVFRRR